MNGSREYEDLLSRIDLKEGIATRYYDRSSLML